MIPTLAETSEIRHKLAPFGIVVWRSRAVGALLLARTSAELREVRRAVRAGIPWSVGWRTGMGGEFTLLRRGDGKWYGLELPDGTSLCMYGFTAEYVDQVVPW